MMAQYRRIKGELPKDTLLFFRLGDFYEMFFEDAQEGAQLLNVALTKRGVVPMCGIPHHAANGYITRILKAGKKVAICDQVEEATPGKLVHREVTAILSPGTHSDDRILVAERNNFLASACAVGKAYGLAVVDLTTGDFRVTELEDSRGLLTELERLRPAELIYPSADNTLRDLLAEVRGHPNGHEDWTFQADTAVFTLREHFKVATLDGFGLRNRPAAVGAAGAVLHYLVQHLRRDVAHLTRLLCYQVTDHLVLDSISLRNLEILEPLNRDSARNITLFGALNRTVTPMGARRLRDWLTQPLSATTAIHTRQEAIQTWLDHLGALEAFRTKVAGVRDLERTLGRLSLGSGNGRDLQALRMALEQVPPIRGILLQLAGTPSAASQESLRDLVPEEPAIPFDSLLADLTSQLCELPALVELLAHAITDEPPLAVKEGGLIREKFSVELDELKAASRDGREWLARLQQDEIARTGIPSLKVGFNSVFGYFIEITKANLSKVPPEYTRKQTIANGERFITPELKAMESKILGAQERAEKLEYELFLKVREEVLAMLRPIQQTAAAIAQLDVLAAFAESARLHDWIRPHVGDEGILQIEAGRHPVLDQTLAAGGGERFVPNDTRLGITTTGTPAVQLALMTGPNMAGKSTYIRQVALLALLAHTGSFVPATRARIDLLDRIFTRIGASDDLSRGQSTFMVEMSEAANILNNATARSLIILDEIGRGTSTFDGLSLAWSIVEHLHHQVGAKTLFATHYHELTELAIKLPRVRNYNVAVREWNDQIVFLHQIVEGAADKSYGIQVARLAGVPKSVIDRAKEILRNLEESELTPEGQPRRGQRHRAERNKLQELTPPPQLDLFS
ncbi:MAG: DNA mismatch repair protein MutS [Pedosphaera sp.]|nr:DNA mismatch repair protein MutS [Pedosphaera sp.]